MLAAVVILAVLYLLGTPVKPLFDSIGGWISEKVSGLNLPNIDIGKIISDNMGTVISSAIGGVITLGSIWVIRKKTEENKKLLDEYQKIEYQKVDLQSQKDVLVKTVVSKEEELKMYAEDKTAEILQSRIGEMQTSFSATETELRRRVRELEEQLANPKVKIVEVVK